MRKISLTITQEKIDFSPIHARDDETGEVFLLIPDTHAAVIRCDLDGVVCHEFEPGRITIMPADREH